MAKVLGVSRNTVVIAYQALLDDGYLVARERSGYYVSDKALDGATPCQRLRPRVAASAGRGGAPVGPAWETRFTVRPALMENISKPLDWQSYAYPFIYGQVDHELSRSPNGATAPARRSGGDGRHHGPTTPGAMTIPCSSSRSGGGCCRAAASWRASRRS